MALVIEFVLAAAARGPEALVVVAAVVRAEVASSTFDSRSSSGSACSSTSSSGSSCSGILIFVNFW